MDRPGSHFREPDMSEVARSQLGHTAARTLVPSRGESLSQVSIASADETSLTNNRLPEIAG